MANTLLQLVDRAYAEMALGAVPSTVISNTNLDVVQFLNLANGLGNDLVQEYAWQKLTKEYRFTTVYYQYTATTTSGSTTISALSSTTGLTSTPTYFSVTGTGIAPDTYLVSVSAGPATAVLSRAATASGTVTLTFAQVMYALPSDYDRAVDQTQWDKSNFWPLIGPGTSQEWQFLKGSSISTTGPRPVYRVLGGLFQIWPPQSSALYYGYEYVSNFWVTASGGSSPTKSSFTVDTDTCVFPDQLMVESLKLRFRREGGYTLGGYSPEEVSRGFSSRLLNIAKASDAGSQVLSMSHRNLGVLISNSNIQDGNFNV